MRISDPFIEVSKMAEIPYELVPKNYEIIGKSMLIKFKKDYPFDKIRLANAFKEVFKLHAVYEIIDIEGPLRIVNVNLLSGERVIEQHVENGIIYSLDPSKIMFSKGNKYERWRVGQIVKKGQIVVDMFAGIGYYSIPASRLAKEVHAIEINPESFHYLLINRYLNNSFNIIPYQMDCRDFPYENFADITLLGHFESLNFIEKAIEIAKNNSFLLIHTVERRNSQLPEIFREYNLKVTSRRIVKSYSPSTFHYVYETIIFK